MVDLHDKFNYFVCLMLKSKKLPLDDIQAKDVDPDDSMQEDDEKERQETI